MARPKPLPCVLWLVDNRNSLDLRFVAHTGDVVNWGWLEPAQFNVASDAAKILENAKIVRCWIVVRNP
jgi:hypothetical protein